MKVIVALLLLFALQAGAGESLNLYARLRDVMVVELSDGAKWQMEKGNCFPVVAYKESHTKLILQLAGTAFIIPAEKAEIVADKDVPAAIASYRENVTAYLDGFSARWRKNAEAGKRP